MRVFLIMVVASSFVLGQGTSNCKGDGSSLLQFCSAYLQAADNGSVASGGAIHATFCIGFLTGIEDFDVMLSQREADRNGGKGLIQHACIAEAARTDQAVWVVVKWLRDHPARLHHPASALAIAALRDAFPCKH
jgi:hypothetical protein